MVRRVYLLPVLIIHVCRYGYKDVRKENPQTFEQLLIESLEKFIRREAQERSLESDENGDIDSEEEIASTSSRVLVGPNGSIYSLLVFHSLRSVLVFQIQTLDQAHHLMDLWTGQWMEGEAWTMSCLSFTWPRSVAWFTFLDMATSELGRSHSLSRS